MSVDVIDTILHHVDITYSKKWTEPLLIIYFKSFDKYT